MVERGPRWSLVVVGGGDGGDGDHGDHGDHGDVGEEGNAAVLLQGTRRRSQSPRGRMPPLTWCGAGPNSSLGAWSCRCSSKCLRG